jgi:Retrotransposon gag protein
MEEMAPAVQVDTPTGPLLIPPVYRPVFNRSAMVTTQIATSTAGPSRTGGGGRGGGSGRGGGGGGGGALAPGQPVGQAPFPWNGLRGVPPQLFKGDRELFDTFLAEWRLYKNVNRNHEVMIVPYNRVLTNLGYIKGPKVSTWVNEYLDTLDQEVAQYGEGAEVLWTNYKAELERTFAYTNKAQDVANALQKLEQKDNLDKYIADFNTLRKVAKWAQNDAGTILFFHRGLKTGLLTEILKDSSNLTTLLDWQKLAIKKHSVYLNLRHELETQKDAPKWAQVMMKKKPPKEPKDPFAMDVDAIRVNTMNKDKKD